MSPKENSDRSAKDWTAQYQAEIQREAVNRAATVESLLISGDFNTIREWLNLWEEEDREIESLRQKYNAAYAELKKEMNRQIWTDFCHACGEVVIRENSEEALKKVPPYTGAEFLEVNLISSHPYKEAFSQFLEIGVDADVANVLAWGNKELDLISPNVENPLRKAASELFDGYERANYWASFEEKFDKAIVDKYAIPNQRVADKKTSRAVGCTVLAVLTGIVVGAVVGLTMPASNQVSESSTHCQ